MHTYNIIHAYMYVCNIHINISICKVNICKKSVFTMDLMDTTISGLCSNFARNITKLANIQNTIDKINSINPFLFISV